MNTTPREYGRQCGRALQDASAGLRVVNEAAKQERSRREADVKCQHRVAAHRLERGERETARFERHFRDAEDAATGLEKQRQQHPSAFALVFGAIAFVLAIAAILGDVAFLGPLLGELLGTDVRDAQTQLGFASLVLAHFPYAAARFPELCALTLSILTSGFVLKVWHEGMRAVQSRLVSRTWFSIQTITGALGTIALVGLALIRLEVPTTGAYDGWLARGVAAVLGVALPLFAAVLFEAGEQAWGGRIRLWRAAWRHRQARCRYDRAAKDRDAAGEEADRLADDLEMLKRADDMGELVEASEAEFLIGYREGVALALGGEYGNSPFAAARHMAFVEAVGGQR